MLPVQIWAPRINRKPIGKSFADDLDRAERSWAGEIRMWLSRDVAEPVALSPARKESLVPAEEANVVDIYCVDSERRVYPRPESKPTWRKGIPRNLWREWLNADYEVNDTTLAPKAIRFPSVENEKIVWKDRDFDVRFDPDLPVFYDMSVENPDWTVANFGRTLTDNIVDHSRRKIDQVQNDGPSGALSEDKFLTQELGSSPGLPLTISWNHRLLKTLLPDGGGLNILHHRAGMRALIEQIRAGYYVEALREVRTIANRFRGEIEVPRVWIEWYPRVFASSSARQTQRCLLWLHAQHGIEVRNIEELKDAPAFLKWAYQPVKIDRIREWVGFFWWDFLQDITEFRENVQLCEACGWVLVGGRSNKKVCSKDDNPACFKKQRMIYMRNWRAGDRRR